MSDGRSLRRFRGWCGWRLGKQRYQMPLEEAIEWRRAVGQEREQFYFSSLCLYFTPSTASRVPVASIGLVLVPVTVPRVSASTKLPSLRGKFHTLIL